MSSGYGATTTQATLPKSKAWQAVSALITGSSSASSTYHYRIVAWNGGGTKDKTVGSDHTFTTASPPDLPPALARAPVTRRLRSTRAAKCCGSRRRGESRRRAPADARVERSRAHAVAGSVLDPAAWKPAGSPRMATRAEVPFDSEIDASHARIALTSALPSGRTQTGRFGGGRFQLRRWLAGATSTSTSAVAPVRGRAGTRLSGRRPPFPRGGGAADHLWGHDSGGRFRTHGRHSQATVRGTRWLVSDRCDGTLTLVTKGSVVGADTVRHRRLVLHAGRAVPRPQSLDGREVGRGARWRRFVRLGALVVALLAFATGVALQLTGCARRPRARDAEGTFRRSRGEAGQETLLWLAIDAKTFGDLASAVALPAVAPRPRASAPACRRSAPDRLRRPVHRADRATRGPRALPRPSSDAGGAVLATSESDDHGHTARARRRREPAPRRMHAPPLPICHDDAAGVVTTVRARRRGTRHGRGRRGRA